VRESVSFSYKIDKHVYFLHKTCIYHGEYHHKDPPSDLNVKNT